LGRLGAARPLKRIAPASAARLHQSEVIELSDLKVSSAKSHGTRQRRASSAANYDLLKAHAARLHSIGWAGAWCFFFRGGSAKIPSDGCLEMRLNSGEALILALTVIVSMVGIIVLVIVLAHRQAAPKNLSGTVFLTVHDITDPASVIAGAEVRLMLPEPITKRTDNNGTAVFVVPGEYLRQTVFVNARAEGYPARKSLKIRLDDRARILLPLSRSEPATADKSPPLTTISNYLYISKTNDMLFGQIGGPGDKPGLYSKLK
jgi:hypothetical protein